MNILSIANHGLNKINYFSNDSLLAGDIVIINSDFILNEINFDKTISRNEMEDLNRFIYKRVNDIQEFVTSGKILLIELGTLPNIRIEIDDFGFNTITNHIHLSQLLPVLDKFGNLNAQNGFNIEFLKKDFIPDKMNYFKKGINKIFRYNFTIPKRDENTFLKVKNTTLGVATYKKIENGIIILLPEFLGKKTKEFNKYYDDLIKLSEYIFTKENSTSDLSSWADITYFEFEKNDLEKVLQLETQKKQLEQDIKKQKQKIEDNQKLKRLIASTGDSLENAVENILDEFGFQNIPQKVKNRTDLIYKQGNDIFVFEIKGIKGSAGEKNSAQLQKWVSDYHYEYGKEPKGILIVNTFKDVQIEERKGDSFPHQMLEYATRQKQCLLTGLELLSMYFDFKNNKITAEEIKKKLLNTIGKLDYPKSELLEVIDIEYISEE